MIIAEEKDFFEKIKRATTDFKEFSNYYSTKEVNHFDCTILSQNFNILIKELETRIRRDNFINRSVQQQENIYGALNFFNQAWSIIEKIRMEKSSIKVIVNQFIFSEN